ncbi:MAG TPA: hypothetical protein VMU27_03375 [Candidatus Paceibacterota bacterium]|nr:hypothetical protein [Candidatus Paceibacterota bacterium]
MIAITLMLSTIGSVALLSFSNQSLLADSRSQEIALQIAQSLLRNEMAAASEDFRQVNSVATTTDGIFQSSLSVSDVALAEYTEKHTTALVSWIDQAHTLREISIPQIVTDYNDPDTLDTCDPELSGNWSTPSVRTYELKSGDLLPSTPPTGHSFSANNPISTLDVYRGRLYIGISKKAAASNDSFFVFDLTNPLQKPTYLGSVDTNASVTEGPNDILIAGNDAYIANSHVSNFKSCKPSDNCSQLQIFSVSNPASISAPIDILMPTSSAPFVTGTSTGQALGNTLFYKNGYLYLGLTKTATGPEFNIIDVHDRMNPRWVSGFSIGATVNQIYVRGNYAYLADDDKSREFIVLTLSDAQNPRLVSFFDPKGTLGYEVGKSEYVRGDTLYAGMSAASGSAELYRLDTSDPASIKTIGSSVIGSTVSGLFARDNTLFLLASTIGQFQAVNLSSSALSSSTPMLSLPGIGAAIDCEGNYFFVGSNNGSRGFISIIGPEI